MRTRRKQKKIFAALRSVLEQLETRQLLTVTGLNEKDRGPAAVSAEALESRLLFALAALSGGSGLSADLSNNAAIRHQQLICDPAPVNGGALSVSYNPSEVSLVSVTPAPGYTVDPNKSVVEVTSSSGGAFAEPLSSYSSESLAETGDVDINFTLANANDAVQGTGTPAGSLIPAGYTLVQQSGPIAYDTCILDFRVLSGVPLSAPQYTVFADPNAISGTPDFLEASGGQTIVAGSAPISPATVGGTPQAMTTTSDGFVAHFYGAYFNSLNAANTEFGTGSYNGITASPEQTTSSYTTDTQAGDYSTHIDTINISNGNQGIAPPDSNANFNTATTSQQSDTGGPGNEFSGLFTTNVVVASSLPGSAPGADFTFLPTTDDGAEIVVDGSTPVGAQNLGVGRGLTQDTDSVGVEWLAGSTHEVQFYYNNGGGGWGFELRWAATAANATTGANTSTALITSSLMTGAGSPGVANLEAPAPVVPPPAPQFTSATSYTLTLSWPSSEVDAASYIIERSSNGGPYNPVNLANPVASADGGTDTYIDTGLQPGTGYSYELVSNSIIGLATEGVASEPTSASNLDFTIGAGGDQPLSPPLNGVVHSSGGNVITLAEVTNATQYDILSSSTVGGTYTQIASLPYNGAVTTLTYTDAGNNANSFYEVEAVDTGVPTTDPGYSTTSAPTTVGSGDGFGANYYAESFNGNPAAGATANGFQAGTVYVPAIPPTFSTIVPTINSGGGLGAGNRPAVTPTSFNSAQSAGPGADFSIDYEFNVIAPYNEQMTFQPRTDDGFQLTVDGVILGTAGDEGATTYNDAVVDSMGNAVTWTAGTTHTVQFAYFQDGGGWENDLYWTSPSLQALNGSNVVPIPKNDAFASGTLPNIPTGSTITTPPAAPPPAQPPIPSAAPAPPVNFTGVPNNQSVTLTWNADTAASYNVYENTTGPITSTTGLTPVKTVTGSPNASPGVATYTYTPTGLTNNTTYYFAVTGVDASGEGKPADVNNVVPIPLPPNAPTGVTSVPYIITATTTPTPTGTSTAWVPQVNISFPAVPFAITYVIQRAPNSTTTPGTPGTFATVPGGGAVTGSGTINFTDTDPTLALGNIYFYQVIAVDATGSSPASAASEVNYTNGVEAHFYNNLYWSAGPADQNGDGLFAPGTGASVNATNENAYLTIVDNSGSDTSAGLISTTGSTGSALYPDPEGIIGPDNYSDVYTGQVTVPVTGTYSFGANTDDDGFLYVDGTLVSSYPGGHGASNNDTHTGITLDAGTYPFDFFQANGGGGWQAHFLWNVSGSGATATLGTTLSVVPSSALTPVSAAPAAPTSLTAGAPTLNASGISYSVPFTFQDNSANEVQYALQRSTDPAFDASGGVVTVATTGLVDNGQPVSSPTSTVPGTPAPTALTDSSAPANGTFYYRVVALNYDASTYSAPTGAIMTGAAAPTAGVLVNFYNNEWWKSTTQNTSAVATGGVASADNATALVSDEQTTLPDINAWGTAGGSGTLESAGNGAEFPDPGGVIGPNDFSTVLTGEIDITTAGAYTFGAQTDDDGYLYIDDQLVSSYPGGHGASGNLTSTPITLTSGEHDVEFFESNGGGGWAFTMLYSGPDNSNAPIVDTGATIGTEGISSTPVVPSTVLTTGSHAVVTPTGFTAVSASNPTQATLTWNSNNTSAIRYVIQRSTDSTFTNAADITTEDAGLGAVAPGGTTVTFTDSGLAINTTYYYRIEAQNYSGTSAFTTVSPSTTVTVPNNVAPVATVTATQDTNNHVDVAFPAEISGYASFVTGYEIQRSDDGATPVTLTTVPAVSGQTEYVYTDSSAVSGQNYTYDVISETGTTSPGPSPATTSNALLYFTGATPASYPAPNGFTGATLNNTGTPQLTYTTGGGAFTPTITSNGQLQLGDNNTAGNESNAVYDTTPVAINGDWETSFDFSFTPPAATNGADGFTFTIQNQGVNAVGGGGGSLGYAGINPSLAVDFNMYSDVTQVGVSANGTLNALTNGYLNMTSLGNNPFHVLTNGSTDIFQASIAFDASTDSTTGAVLHIAVRDTTTGLGYNTNVTLPAGSVAASPLFGPNSSDYIGFTAADGGAFSEQFINDWVFNNTSTAVLPTGVTASAGAVFTYNSTTNDLSLTSGTLTFNNVGSATALTLNVTADGTGSNLVFDTTTYLNSLTLTDGATAQVVQSGTDTVTGTGSGAKLTNFGTTLTQANTKVLVLNSLSIPITGATLSGGGTNSAQGTLDLTNNAMILNYTPGTGTAALAAADALAKSGSDGAVWDGTGITSSNAEEDNAFGTGYTAVGIGDNNPTTGEAYNTFAGQNVSSGTQILFMYTYNGDADLNGLLNVTDTESYASGLPSRGPQGIGWQYAELDYGATAQGSISDLQLLEAGFRGYRAEGMINITES